MKAKSFFRGQKPRQTTSSWVNLLSDQIDRKTILNIGLRGPLRPIFQIPIKVILNAPFLLFSINPRVLTALHFLYFNMCLGLIEMASRIVKPEGLMVGGHVPAVDGLPIIEWVVFHGIKLIFFFFFFLDSGCCELVLREHRFLFLLFFDGKFLKCAAVLFDLLFFVHNLFIFLGHYEVESFYLFYYSVNPQMKSCILVS